MAPASRRCLPMPGSHNYGLRDCHRNEVRKHSPRHVSQSRKASVQMALAAATASTQHKFVTACDTATGTHCRNPLLIQARWRKPELQTRDQTMNRVRVPYPQEFWERAWILLLKDSLSNETSLATAAGKQRRQAHAARCMQHVMRCPERPAED